MMKSINRRAFNKITFSMIILLMGVYSTLSENSQKHLVSEVIFKVEKDEIERHNKVNLFN